MDLGSRYMAVYFRIIWQIFHLCFMSLSALMQYFTIKIKIPKPYGVTSKEEAENSELANVSLSPFISQT